MNQYLLSGDDHDDDHEAYRLHDDEDDDDAEIYFIGQCCETRWFASAPGVWWPWRVLRLPLDSSSLRLFFDTWN